MIYQNRFSEFRPQYFWVRHFMLKFHFFSCIFVIAAKSFLRRCEIRVGTPDLAPGTINDAVAKINGVFS